MTILQRSVPGPGNRSWTQRVIDEIINNEEGYVKNLADVIDGLLKEAQLRNDIFILDNNDA